MAANSTARSLAIKYQHGMASQQYRSGVSQQQRIGKQ